IIPIYGLNYRDERDDGLKFVNKLGNPYQAIIFDYNGRLGIELGVYGAPETFLIDENNRIIYRHVGVVNEKVWTEIFQPLLMADSTANGAGQ
ncbi:MAG: DsbE family thiol:disulfide interchange protein, partial [Gammaproteobacteria bacterium]